LTAGAAGVDGGPTTVHGTPEGSSCCQMALRSVPSISTGVQDLPPSSSVATPPPSPAECLQRTPSARSKSRTPLRTVVHQSNDCPQSSASPSPGNKRVMMKNSLPLTKCNDGRRPGSARSSSRTHERFPGTPVEGLQRQQHRPAVVGGITVADDVATISSSSDAYSDDTASSANDQNSASPPPGQ